MVMDRTWDGTCSVPLHVPTQLWGVRCSFVPLAGLMHSWYNTLKLALVLLHVWWTKCMTSMASPHYLHGRFWHWLPLSQLCLYSFNQCACYCTTCGNACSRNCTWWQPWWENVWACSRWSLYIACSIPVCALSLWQCHTCTTSCTFFVMC